MKKIQYLFLCSLIMVLTACEKDTVATNFAPGVTTGNATNIYRKGAVLSGSIRKSGNATAESYGILFSELESMAECVEYSVPDNNSDFSISISNLTPGTTYYYCAYANSSVSVAKGEIKNFTTPKSNVPIFAEITLQGKDEFGCKVSVPFVDEGGSEISLSGFCWSKQGEGEPTANSSVQNADVENGSMSATITGLEPSAEYLIRAYAVNSDGIGYSEIISVSTNEVVAPILSAITLKDSLDFSVTIEAQIVESGSYDVSKAGFCWSTTNKTPTIEDEKKDLEGPTLSMALDNLKPSTTYYIRAYATSKAGTSYSEVITFTTADAKAPTLSTITKKNSSYFSVSVEAKITDAGTSAVTNSGFCWSTTNEAPTVDDMKKELSDSILTMTLEDLAPSTTYYIRAYATNDVGTSYSEVLTFITADAKIPTLSNIEETAASDFSVSIKAEITDSGTSEVTNSGFCWSSSNEAPTTDDTKKELAGPTLETTLSDLIPGTTYYIRAYATNEQGTSYSEVFTFKTADAKAPILSTITKTASSDFSVSIKAEITDSGTSEVTNSGFCWSTTNETPTTDDTKKELAGPTLETTLSDLIPGTTYYIRAYATNEQGTSYSEVFTFKTAAKDASNGNTDINSLPIIKW